jgi:hypothetical protein
MRIHPKLPGRHNPIGCDRSSHRALHMASKRSLVTRYQPSLAPVPEHCLYKGEGMVSLPMISSGSSLACGPVMGAVGGEEGDVPGGHLLLGADPLSA